MMKDAPEWARTSDPVIRSPAHYVWTTAPTECAIRGLYVVYLAVTASVPSVLCLGVLCQVMWNNNNGI